MKVVVAPIPKSGPRGDRDPNRHPYFDYEIHLCEPEKITDDSTRVHTVCGFDNWWTTIKNEEEVRSEAEKYADKLANRLGTEVVWLGKDCKVFVVFTTVQRVLAKSSEEAINAVKSMGLEPIAMEAEKYDKRR